MSSDVSRPQESNQPPQEESWRVGRRWATALFGVLAGLNLITAVIDITDGATPGDLFAWLRLAIVVAFLVLAVAEFRRRVAVDAEGVHVVEMHGRRTYPWRDVSEVRAGRPTLVSGAFVYLVRHGDKQVELPRSGDHLSLLQRWHAAMSTR